MKSRHHVQRTMATNRSSSLTRSVLPQRSGVLAAHATQAVYLKKAARLEEICVTMKL
jgi:hypothetical protein